MTRQRNREFPSRSPRSRSGLRAAGASLMALAVAVPVLLSDPLPAAACSPPAPGVIETMPADGSIHFANAPVVLSGYGLDASAQLTATIDGEPATATIESGPLPGSLAVRVSPEPADGQMVSLNGNVCTYVGGFESNACEVQLTYRASGRDEDAPLTPEVAALDVHDYVDFESSGGDCQTSSDLAYHVQLDPGPPPPPVAATPVYYRLELARDASFKEIVRTAVSTSASFTVRLLESDLGGRPAPEAFCFRAMAFDLAGNASATSKPVCRPCYYRVEEPSQETEQRFTPPEAPEFTAEDVYAGGSCAPDGDPDRPVTSDPDDPTPRDPVTPGNPATGDDGTPEAAGRGCSTAGAGARGGSAPAYLLALAWLLALGARRPRRRPGPRA